MPTVAEHQATQAAGCLVARAYVRAVQDRTEVDSFAVTEAARELADALDRIFKTF